MKAFRRRLDEIYEAAGDAQSALRTLRIKVSQLRAEQASHRAQILRLVHERPELVPEVHSECDPPQGPSEEDLSVPPPTRGE